MNNPTVYRNEWASSPEEDWGESTEHYVPASFHIANVADNEDIFAGRLALTDGFISKLRRRYDFREELAVENFLRENLQENPRLGSLLLEAYEVIREHFGSGTRVALEVVTDPEAPGDRQLFVVIRTRFRPKIARALLSELDRGWWLDVLPVAQGKMELAVE